MLTSAAKYKSFYNKRSKKNSMVFKEFSFTRTETGKDANIKCSFSFYLHFLLRDKEWFYIFDGQVLINPANYQIFW